MSDHKKYEDILEERHAPDRDEKIGKELMALVPVNQNTSLIVQNFGGKKLSKDLREVPEIDAKLALSSDAVSEHTKKQLAVITDELVQGYYAAPRRRTDLEKKMSVLQANRFTTNAACWHQANLEQFVQSNNLIDGVLNYERDKIKLQKMFLKHEKLSQRIEKKIASGKDATNDQLDLQLLEIEMRRKISLLKSARVGIESTANELIEWSNIKEEKYQEAVAAGEHFDTDDVNAGQEIPLAQRFFQNYIMAHKTAPDGASTSDILNIDGLALSAMKFGMKNGTLGKMMETLGDEQIQYIFAGIYGVDVHVVRQGSLPIIIANKADNAILFVDKRVPIQNMIATPQPVPSLPEPQQQFIENVFEKTTDTVEIDK